MNFKKIAATCCLFSLFTMLASPTWADMQSEVQQLQQRWAQVNYQLAGKVQLTAFETLIEDAANVAKKHPDAAPVWTWNGIIKSTYAGAKGGLGALKFAKASKADLEHALDIEPQAMNGSAYTSLGTLYFNVPGWPIGFGDNDKAEELLLKALAINPTGIDSNYFYGDYLLSENRYKEAQIFLLKAQSAPKRAHRPLADTGRQKEISEALATVRKKL